MPAWIRAMLSTPDEPRTLLSRYTSANGVFYMALGAFFYAWPQGTAYTGARDLVGQEVGMMRVIGMCLGVVGWFYFMGGRTNRDSFGLATVADRVLVPFFVIPVILLGELDPALGLPIAILDPILGLGAYAIWKRDQRP